MASPKNLFTGNLQLALTGGDAEISSSSVDPPTDSSTDATTNASIAMTQSGLYQRVGGVWVKFEAATRFITGIANIAEGATNRTAAAPVGASNGDAVFVSPANTANFNTATAIVGYRASITAGNIVINAVNNAGVLTAVAGAGGAGVDLYFMIDTSP